MSQAQEKPGGIRGETLPGHYPSSGLRGAADAIDFYKKAFGAEEIMRLAGANGKLMHAAVRIGNAASCSSMKRRNGARFLPSRLAAAR